MIKWVFRNPLQIDIHKLHRTPKSNLQTGQQPHFAKEYWVLEERRCIGLPNDPIFR